MSQTKTILKKIKKLDIKTKQLVDGIITGNYNSVFKGQGIEFSEIRDYRAGDDIRAIDWKVTARFNHPYIKEFIEERDLQVYFVIDVSGSGSFGTNISKKEKSLEIIASLMFAALRNNDGVGVFLVTDNVEKFIPVRKGRKHVLKLLDVISNFTPNSAKTSLKTPLERVSQTIKRKSIVFVISDFIDNSDYLKPLKILRKRHDVIALRIIDPREKEIPDVGLIELEDEESGEQLLVDTSDEDFRNSYSRLVAENDSRFLTNMMKNKVDTISLLTDQNYSIPLKKILQKKVRKNGRI
ncbi:hypothetical protein NKOR_04510 [Candidatus Nitrosopumilus koreensis AR1]|uniref:VWFA domain-containing protein n=1 Tax=Candidatus Nitrosopumilus koreensis AR1 TaxID=1229908 RepID=K0B724_9ARCH|nr:DUF58 domain-containing protein [Candidatus Nitrosopumilus koreensis]AFS80790.1 hypothetical protein NKOR_04510 [Candidatus Nitrosopumilus koreensis AR1]